jgi:ABC-type molybdate transport system permease subunit
MLIFSILAVACAVYFGCTLELSMRFAEGTKAPLVQVLMTLGRLLPVVVCGAVQYWKLAQSGVTGSRLWWAVAGTAIGAPIAGIILMLIVVFALFSKQP